MKLLKLQLQRSLPAWGVWIEMQGQLTKMTDAAIVTPRMGSVD